MKTPKILCAFAALAFSLIASAQTATTDPVGFSTVSAAANSDVAFGLPLNRAAVLQSNVTGVTGNIVTVGATMTASQFVYAAGTQVNYYYVSVKNTVSPTSLAQGKWFTVAANSATTLTLDPGSPSTVQAQGLVSGDTIEVIPFWSLNTLFVNGGGLTASPDALNPEDIVLQFSAESIGVNLAATQSSFYSTDTVNVGPAGWYDVSSFDSTGHLPLSPDTMLKVRNKGAAQSFTVVGSVPMSSKSTEIVRLSTAGQDNLLVNPFPVPVALSQLNLFESGAFSPSPAALSPTDVLYVFLGSEVGFNSTPSKAYIYSTDIANVGVAGWYDASTLDGPYLAADKIIPAGAGLVVRKASGPLSSVTWTAPKPY